MNASRLLASLVVALSCAAACGGRTSGNAPGDGGGGSDGGSDDGATCRPLPGCSSTTECPAGDGCNSCQCTQGEWSCTTLGCGGDDNVDASETCPAQPPKDGSSCSVDGQQCGDWGTCSPECTCVNGAWKCIVPPCPPPECPPNAPQQQASCPFPNEVCDYPINGVCTEYECRCSAGNAWNCEDTDCFDGGPGEGGDTDGGQGGD